IANFSCGVGIRFARYVVGMVPPVASGGIFGVTEPHAESSDTTMSARPTPYHNGRFIVTALFVPLDSCTASPGLLDAGNTCVQRRVGKECRSRWSPYH